MYKLYILLAIVFIFCKFSLLHSRTSEGFIKYTMANATIYYPPFIMSRYVIASPSSF